MNPLFLVPLLFATALPSILAQDPLPAPTPRQATDTADRTFVPADREPVWTAFRDRRPGDWHAYWNHATGTPSAVFGPGIALADWRGNTVEEARRHALALLDAERELLGIDAASDVIAGVVTKSAGIATATLPNIAMRPCMPTRTSARPPTSGRPR